MARPERVDYSREESGLHLALENSTVIPTQKTGTSPRVMVAFSLAGMAFGLFYVAWFLFAYDEPHWPMVALSIATSVLFASGMLFARTRFATAAAIVIVTLACVALLAYTAVLTTDSDVQTLYLAAGFGMLALVPEHMWRARIGYGIVIVGLALTSKFIFPGSSSVTVEDLARDDFISEINRTWTVLVIVMAMVTLLYRSTRHHRYLSGAAMVGEYRANTDAMTGIANRRPVLASLRSLEERGASSYAVAIIDIDDFKSINDRLGHEEGDALISAIAQRLQRHFRDSDLVSRWGGDEFLILLPHVTSEELFSILERLRESIAKSPFSLGTASIAITLSIGAAVTRPDCSSRAVVRAADQALYAAKHTGRNTVVLAEPTPIGEGKPRVIPAPPFGP